MKPTVEVVQETSWLRALNAARRTVGKEPMPDTHIVSEKFRKESLMAEHAQIKLVEYRISFKNLRQWVGVHLLRHEHTIPMIHSQREDRRDIDSLVEKIMSTVSEDIRNSEDFNKRDYLFQGEPNDQDFYVNAQTLINISRKRLCNCASKETWYAWNIVKKAICKFDPIMAHYMVRNCIYRGRCPEVKCCGYYKTEAFKRELEDYWGIIQR